MSASAPRVGERFAGKYLLEAELGVGGMGAVFRAQHVHTQGRVALKVLRAGERDPQAAQRLLAEARSLARLHHPRIVRLLDADLWEGECYLVQELVEGVSLREVLSQELVLDARATLELLVPLLDALEYSHAQGVVHRDLKPENILLTQVGARREPTLIDFGIALASQEQRHTRGGAAVGTPQYMSPEQAWGREDLDGRTDLWSLGAVAFECLAGAPPYEGPNDRAVLAALVANDPPHLSSAAQHVDEALADAVMRALRRARDERVQSAAVWRAALLDLEGPLRSEPWYQELRARYALEPAPSSAATTPSPVASPREPASSPPRSRALPALAAGTLLVALSAGALALRRAPGSAAPAPRASAPLAPAPSPLPAAPLPPPAPLAAPAPAPPPAPLAAPSPPHLAARDTAAPQRPPSRPARVDAGRAPSAPTVGANRAPIVEAE